MDQSLIFVQYKRKAAVNNVTNYFYQFEFQKRGTANIDVLTWLKNPAQIGLEHIHGDIPWTNPDAAYLTFKLQKSDKPALEIHDDDTTVEMENEIQSIKIKHPADAFAHNLRGYISTVLPALESMQLPKLLKHVFKITDQYWFPLPQVIWPQNIKTSLIRKLMPIRYMHNLNILNQQMNSQNIIGIWLIMI